MLIFIIVISGSTVLVRTLSGLHRRFRNLIKTLGRTTLEECYADITLVSSHDEGSR
jgi:hypothetical protein